MEMSSKLFPYIRHGWRSRHLPSAVDTNKRHSKCVCAPPLFFPSLWFFPCQTSVHPPAAKPAKRSLKGILTPALPSSCPRLHYHPHFTYFFLHNTKSVEKNFKSHISSRQLFTLGCFIAEVLPPLTYINTNQLWTQKRSVKAFNGKLTARDIICNSLWTHL